MKKALVIFYTGNEVSYSTMKELVKAMGNHAAEGTEISIQRLNLEDMARSIAANVIKMQRPETEESSVNSAIVAIGGQFEKQITLANQSKPSSFVVSLSRTLLGYGENTAAIKNACKILAKAHVDYKSDVARRWNFTGFVHQLTKDVFENYLD